MHIIYTGSSILGKICFNIFGKLEVNGEKSVIPFGPLIVAVNHVSIADVPILNAIFPRRLWFLAKKEIFKNKLASSFLYSFGAYPINRFALDRKALDWAYNLLAKDEVITLFPEGSRSPNGRLKKAHNGIAYLASKTQAPIQPVTIIGTERINTLWKIPFPFCKIQVNIGDPFTLPVIEGTLTKSILDHFTEMIMLRLTQILPRERHGYYHKNKFSN